MRFHSSVVIAEGMECGACRGGIAINGLPLFCFRCEKYFHAQCSSVENKAAARLITDNANVFFKCDDCLSRPSCGEQNSSVFNIGSMEEDMKKISSLSDSIDDIRNQLAAQIGNALKSGMEELVQNVNGTLNEAVNNIEKLINGKMENMTSSFFQFNADKMKLATMKSTRDASRSVHLESTSSARKKRKISNTDEIDDFDNDDVFEDANPFVTVVNKKARKSKSKGPKPNSPKKSETRPVIVIKPTSNQSSEDTRKFLYEKLDPKIHKISSFRNGKDGSVIVKCATGYNVDLVKNGMQNDLGENYSAVVPTSVPRLKVLGMSYKYSSDVIIDYLKSHNEDIAINDVKVLNVYENPRFRYKQYNAVIEVDVDTYSCLLTAKKVNVKFDRCLVVPAVSVLRCFECGEFGHMSTKCNNSTACSKCSGSHKTSECTSTVLKCVNCIKMNNERNMNLNINHPAFSKNECMAYKKLFDQKKSSLHFNK